MPGPSEWFDTAADAVSEVTARWTKVGALAAIEYRLAPRGTTDADILVEWRDDLVAHLETKGYSVDVRGEPGARPHLLLARGRHGDVDVLIPTVEYQELALDRGVANHHVLTVEDVIIHKLIAWRARDKDDIASILAAGHDFDDAYIDHWARQWEVVDRWAGARRGNYQQR